jgi:hypothetical protein
MEIPSIETDALNGKAIDSNLPVLMVLAHNSRYSMEIPSIETDALNGIVVDSKKTLKRNTISSATPLKLTPPSSLDISSALLRFLLTAGKRQKARDTAVYFAASPRPSSPSGSWLSTSLAFTYKISSSVPRRLTATPTVSLLLISFPGKASLRILRSESKRAQATIELSPKVVTMQAWRDLRKCTVDMKTFQMTLRKW